MGNARQIITMMAWLVLMPLSAWAAHPLITDDSGTQGAGKYQLEITGERDYDKDVIAGVQVSTTAQNLAKTLSYGMTDTVDLVVGIPYLWNRTKGSGVPTFSGNGIGDVTLEAKWRFYEENALSFALKPGISLPTGSENKGLGQGKTGYSLFFIASQEMKPWTFHANFGYMMNGNELGENKDLWHLSAAVTYAMSEHFTAVADIGMERNPDKTVHQEPAFLLGGIIYSMSEKIDLDLGVKTGMNHAETDQSFLAGATFRF